MTWEPVMPSKETFKAFGRAIKDYDLKFGEGTFGKTVPLTDPLHPDEEEMQRAIQKIRQAIKTGKKLPELDPDSALKPIY
ncbi:hypothetical protein SAMN05216431_102139 [Ligilactobacillus sp. WC1T17]|uniref:Uncharacterized protein n=1 Tax=Ligilactobacillus ruminis TaxID=1623 RepID=A0ABY1A9R9_9LACO|nr:hypothetical protein SAMN05216431_102139 [Ligilactobacillus ruminis]